MVFLKIVLGTFLIIVGAFVYQYVYKLYRTISFYRAQGVTILPGCGRPFFGNVIDYIPYAKEEKASDEPLTEKTTWLLNKVLDKESSDSYRPQNHKVIL